MSDRNSALVHCLISIADDHLILGHRLSEWCGHAPILEEDLSMPNMALDLLGQARNFYFYAAELEGKGRSEDDLAYLRTDREYLNCLLVERPNGDFGHTMLRQFYFAAFMQLYWRAACNSRDQTISGFAQKAVKEIAYHLRHCGEWVVRLGDGTQESASRMAKALEALHPYTEELFRATPQAQICATENILPLPETLHGEWTETVEHVFDEACLNMPEVAYFQHGGREGFHTEDFGHLLSELQYMQRTYPGLTW